MSLFNQLPVLDKGFVAHAATGLKLTELDKLSQHYYNAKIPLHLMEFASLTVTIKCPIFVNLYLMQEIGIKTVAVQSASDSPKIETYIPTVADIGCNEVMMSQEIRDHMIETAEALEVTSKGYEQDGCDRFASQVNIPLSVYNEVIAHGSLVQWIKFFKKKNLPKPIQAYQNAIMEIAKADFPNLNALMNKVS